MLLALGAVFLIVTTIRLSVMARREEIGIMKYLGASDWFVRFPFLVEGIAMGWLGTIVATAAGRCLRQSGGHLTQDAFAFSAAGNFPGTAAACFYRFALTGNMHGRFWQLDITA